MASVNRVILIGNLGKDPELRYTTSGKAVASFSVATSEEWKDKDGNKKQNTEWHNIVVWGIMAENAKEYLAKGSSVYLEGSLKTQSWDDKQGVKKYRTEVVAQRMQFLSRREDIKEELEEKYDGKVEPDKDDLPF